MSSRRCQVCGGTVQPLKEQAGLGSCEGCGIVYLLRGEPSKGEPSQDESVPGRYGFRWRCPDCDVELTAENDGDLSFLTKEHIRTYHPNRPLE